MNDQFTFALLYAYAWLLVTMCFILYAFLKNDGIERTWIEGLILIIWKTNITLHLFLLTVPAYTIYEKVYFIIADETK